MTKTRKGNQRPTRSHILPYKRTKGKEAVELYNSTGRTAQEWQGLLLNDIMAVNPDGLWTHQKFGFSLPRRNGKNEVVTMREFWGLANGETMFHTAHRTTTSHTAWERLVKLLAMAGYEELGRAKKGEEPPPNSFRTTKQYGLESITMTNGGTINFRTRTNSGGLGEGYDLLVIDEAQEYTIEQESTLTYVVSDSMNPQTLFLGTPPTMVSTGTVFSDMRESVLGGNTEEEGWAEWSVDREPEDLYDAELWYQTNPSLGTILTERKIRAEIGKEKLDFVIQRLGYWFKYSLKSEFSAEEWAGLQVDELPELTGRLYAGVKYGIDNVNVALSIAVRTVTGEIFVESIDCRSRHDGDAWLIEWISNLDFEKVVIDGKGGQYMLEQELLAALPASRANVNSIIKPTSAEYQNAMAMFHTAVDGGIVRHKGQPSLAAAVTNSKRRNIGTGGGYGYESMKEGVDIILLDSVALALWACGNSKPKKKQRISY